MGRLVGFQQDNHKYWWSLNKLPFSCGNGRHVPTNTVHIQYLTADENGHDWADETNQKNVEICSKSWKEARKQWNQCGDLLLRNQKVSLNILMLFAQNAETCKTDKNNPSNITGQSGCETQMETDAYEKSCKESTSDRSFKFKTSLKIDLVTIRIKAWVWMV